MPFARSYTSSALISISGEWSNNIPVRDVIVLYEGGSVMDLTGLEFEFQLRCDRNSDSPDLVASTDSGLDITTVENDDGNDIDALQFDDVNISSLDGDYFADFIMKDGSGNYTHLAHGVVSIRNDPATPTI